jgi:hypothetical protein
VSSLRKVQSWRGEKRSNDHEDRARLALNNERGIGVRSTSYIVNNPRFKEAMENEDLLGPGCFLSGKNPGHSVSFSTGHFRPCDLRREGSKSQLL